MSSLAAASQKKKLKNVFGGLVLITVMTMLVIYSSELNHTDDYTSDRALSRKPDNVGSRSSTISKEGNEQQLTNSKPKIPHTIVFTYKYDIFKTKEPKMIYDNMMKTVDSFRKAWNEPNAPVKLYTDPHCIGMLAKVEPQLVPFFREERYGWNKADLCRIVALYLHGGYYFDSDMEVITPPIIPPTVSFASVIQPRRKDFFQSFMASSPSNPILFRALKNMHAVYNGQRQVKMLLGTETLKWAYDSVPPTKRGEVLLLEEVFLEPHVYPDVPRQDGYGCCCNYVVHDPDTKVVHFYSRMVGPIERCSIEPVEGW